MKDVLKIILLTNLIHHRYEFLPIHVSRLRQRIMQAPYKLVIYGNIYAVGSTYKAVVFFLKFSLIRRICLESVPSYDFAACIRALLRSFRQIRTLWSILSNNGTNFTSKETAQFIFSINIKWSFIPHAMPWWGGVNMRIIRCVKYCLKKH